LPDIALDAWVVLGPSRARVVVKVEASQNGRQY
jgi:hypothetical protein